MPVVRELIPAGVAQHVRMGLEAELCSNPGTLDHAGEPGGAKRRATLGREHECGLRLLLPLEPPQGAQFVA